MTRKGVFGLGRARREVNNSPSKKTANRPTLFTKEPSTTKTTFSTELQKLGSTPTKNAQTPKPRKGEEALANIGHKLQKLVFPAQIIFPNISIAAEDQTFVASTLHVVNRRLGTFRTSDCMIEWDRLLGHILKYKEKLMSTTEFEVVAMLWVESCTCSEATKYKYAKSIRSILNHYAPTVQCNRLVNYIDSLVRAGATKPTQQAAACTHQEVEDLLEKLPTSHATMTVFQLMMGLRFIDDEVGGFRSTRRQGRCAEGLCLAQHREEQREEGKKKAGMGRRRPATRRDCAVARCRSSRSRSRGVSTSSRSGRRISG